jgi:semaphorin 6
MKKRKKEKKMDFEIDHFFHFSLGERLTVIESDPGVQAVDGTFTDILFVGTTNGRVLKISSNTNTLIEALQVFPYHIPVRSLLVAKDQVIVLSDHEVNAFPLDRCSSSSVKTCSDCVALQDPYCAWDLQSSVCRTHHDRTSLDRSSLIQDLNHGYHAGCPIIPG